MMRLCSCSLRNRRGRMFDRLQSALVLAGIIQCERVLADKSCAKYWYRIGVGDSSPSSPRISLERQSALLYITCITGYLSFRETVGNLCDQNASTWETQTEATQTPVIEPAGCCSPLMSPPAQKALPPAPLMITTSVSLSFSHFWNHKQKETIIKTKSYVNSISHWAEIHLWTIF